MYSVYNLFIKINVMYAKEKMNDDNNKKKLLIFRLKLIAG